METRPPLHRTKIWRILAFSVLAILPLLPRAADAALEYSNLYGMGAASFSLGPSGMPSLDDPMAYLLNPAMFALDTRRKLILTIGGMKPERDDDESFSLSAFGYQTPKSIFTLMRFQEPLISQHNEFVITAARKGGGIAYGANVRIFEFREQSGAKDSSATLDVGVHGQLAGRGLWYDVVLRNLIGPNLSVDPMKRQLDPELPKLFTLGLGYQAMENIRLYASYQNELSSQGDPDRELEISRWNIGAEYLLPDKYAFRAGGSEQSITSSSEPDRAAAAGVGFKSDNILLDMGFMVKHTDFSNAQMLTFAYSKKEEAPPPPEPEKKEPEKIVQPPLPVIEEEKPEDAFEEYTPPVVEKPPVSKTSFKNFDDFSVAPEAILAAAPGRSDFSDIAGHWAAPAVRELARNGYVLVESEAFSPSIPINREDFYRLLFTVQLEDLFRKPLEIKLTTPVGGKLTVELEGADTSKPMKLTSVTIDDAGKQTITLPPDIFEENNVPPGRYKVVSRLESDSGETFSGSASVTVLDTAMDFARFAPMKDDERKTAVENMKTRLAPLGMPLDYLDSLQTSGDVTRIEALTSSIMALGVTWSEIPAQDVFSDTWGLDDKAKKAVYIATRGFSGLKGSALMNGYPGGVFKPQNTLTRAEAAAFTAKLRLLSPNDVAPPFRPPWKTGQVALFPETSIRTPSAPTRPQKPRKNPYWLVALTTTTEKNALEFAAALSGEGLKPVIVEEKAAETTLYHVLFGVHETVVEAEAERRRLEDSGYQVSLSGPPDEESFTLPALPLQSEKKQPAKEKYVEEILLPNPPPVPDNLDSSNFNSPTVNHERYEIITK